MSNVTDGSGGVQVVPPMDSGAYCGTAAEAHFVVASPSTASTASPTSPNNASPSSWHPSSAASSPSSAGSVAIDVKAPGGVAMGVSEEAQAAEKAEKAREETANANWFKQRMARVKGSLCGPLHLGDILFVAWILVWMIAAAATKDDIKWFWLVLFFLFYFSYLHWNWKSDEREYIWSMQDVGSFEAYWKHLRTQNPIVKMKTESWHWQRRVHTSTYRNASGGTTTSTTVTYVRAVTHTEEMSFPYSLCVDVSLDVAGSDLAQNNCTFVTLWKEVTFGNIETALSYANQLQALKSRNQGRDAFMDTFEWTEIPGWRTRVGVYRDALSRPMFLRSWIFALCCVCLLSWPIKFYSEFVAKKGGFTMKKQITQ